MKPPAHRLILGAAAIAAAISTKALAQSNVYSLSVYAGGTSYQDLCAFDFQLPPFHYKLTLRSRYETSDGLVIIDRHEKERGGVLCRYLDVEAWTEKFTIPLDRPQPLRARQLAAEMAKRERQKKAWLASGRVQTKTFILSNRTDSLADQGDLFELEQRATFHDRYRMRAMAPEPNVIRITASTNDMPIWDRIIQEFDKPRKSEAPEPPSKKRGATNGPQPSGPSTNRAPEAPARAAHPDR